MNYNEVLDLYTRAGGFTPTEPLYLTKAQLAWLRTQLPAAPASKFVGDTCGAHNDLFGTPIYQIETVEYSTPYLLGWENWPQHLLRRSPLWRRAFVWFGLCPVSLRRHQMQSTGLPLSARWCGWCGMREKTS